MKHLNNRGFSLLELLIAVLILSIITVPLLHTYVTSSRTAAKSRQAGDATAAAQNIVETIQANSVSSALSADYASVAALFGADTAAVTQVADGSVVTLTGVRSGSSLFDAKVTLDPDAYSEINSKEITQYTSMDSVFVQDTGSLDPDKLALDTFNTSSGYAVPLKQERSVQITITSSDPGEEGKTAVQAKLQFHYSFLYNETVTVDGISTTTVHTMEINSDLYSLFPSGYTVDTGTSFSVYLLFNPYYASTSSLYKDDITVSNTSSDLPCSVFLVKQKVSGATAENENSYSAQVTLQESHIADNHTFQTKVFSNIGQNLLTGNALTGNISYRKFYSQDFYVPGDFGTGELVDRQAENRMYQITVSLYPSGSSDQLMTFRATKLQ